jgi:hypothetical protein
MIYVSSPSGPIRAVVKLADAVAEPLYRGLAGA